MIRVIFADRMPNCAACTEEITSRAPGIRCFGRCSKFYHGRCVGLNKRELQAFKSPGFSWRCADCRGKFVDSDTRKSIIVGDLDDSDNDATVAIENNSAVAMLRTIQADLKSLNAKYDAILTSVNFCSDKISSFEAALKSYDSRITSLEKANKDNAALRSEVQVLSSRLDALEQYSRLDNLEIQGVPQASNENVMDILSKIGNAIDCPISRDDVVFAHRVQHQASADGQHKSIVLKLNSRLKRDALLAAAKRKRVSSDSTGTGLRVEGVAERLFINEHLSVRNKLLLRETKQAARNKNYKYVWIKNGHILVRHHDGSGVIRISNASDIKKIK